MVPTFSRRVNGSGLELQAGGLDDRRAYSQLRRPVAEYFLDFYADTSGQSPVAIGAALEFFGPEHVLLGSDTPFIAPRDHLATLARMNLSEPEHELLTSGNARRVLGLV